MKRSEIRRRPLPDVTIRNLEPESKTYLEKDSDRLFLRVTSKGTKDWQYRYKLRKGTWTRKGLGGFPALSAKRARILAAQLDIRADKGEYLFETAFSDASKITISMASEKYIAYKTKTLAASSIKIISGVFGKHINPVLGDLVVEQVTRIQCTQAIESIEKKGFPSVRDSSRKYLNQFFNWCMARGYCENNPASTLRQVTNHHESRRRSWLEEHEIGDFLRAIEQTNLSTTNREAVYTVVFTLARASNIQTMHWDDIDLAAGIWSVPAQSMKGLKAGLWRCPLVSQVLDILHTHENKTGYVFTYTKRRKRVDGSYPEKMADTALAKQFIRLGYRDRLVPHGCRHTASTLLNEHGWDSRLIEAQLAHKVPGVEGIYNQAKYVEKRREMMQWYADHIVSLGGNG